MLMCFWGKDMNATRSSMLHSQWLTLGVVTKNENATRSTMSTLHGLGAVEHNAWLILILFQRYNGNGCSSDRMNG